MTFRDSLLPFLTLAQLRALRVRDVDQAARQDKLAAFLDTGIADFTATDQKRNLARIAVAAMTRRELEAFDAYAKGRVSVL